MAAEATEASSSIARTRVEQPREPAGTSTSSASASKTCVRSTTEVQASVRASDVTEEKCGAGEVEKAEKGAAGQHEGGGGGDAPRPA